MLMKDIKDGTNRRRDIPRPWKNQYHENDYTTPNNLQIQCNAIKLTMAFFTELKQSILQFVWKQKRPQIA